MSQEPSELQGTPEGNDLNDTLVGNSRKDVQEVEPAEQWTSPSPISVEINTSFESARQNVEDVETSSHYTADTTETGSFHTPLDVSSSDGEQPVDLSIQIPDFQIGGNIDPQSLHPRHSPDGGEWGKMKAKADGEEDESDAEGDNEATPILTQAQSFVIEQPKLLLHEPEVTPSEEKPPLTSAEVHPTSQPRQRRKRTSDGAAPAPVGEATPLLQDKEEPQTESGCYCCALL